jgi:FolB domain-containing protein
VDTIVISELEVCFRVGVPDEERRYPQRLLLTVEMRSDFGAAIESDSIAATVDYSAVSQVLMKFGEGKEWKLIEKLAGDIAEMVLSRFHPAAVTVELKKFVIPQAQFVAVRLTRERV